MGVVRITGEILKLGAEMKCISSSAVRCWLFLRPLGFTLTGGGVTFARPIGRALWK